VQTENVCFRQKLRALSNTAPVPTANMMEAAGVADRPSRTTDGADGGGRFAEELPMTSATVVRDPVRDYLLTPQNATMVIIDYQPVQVSSVTSRDRHLLVRNVVSMARLGKLFGLPTILSTVNVKTGINKSMIEPIMAVFPGVEPIDRTAINAWEDEDFVRAVKATGRKKLIMAALWTEVCLVFPALDALRDGFEVFAVVDAVGGTTVEAHEAGLQRLVQAGGQLVTWGQLACELQRDWNRTKTAGQFAEILFAP
jgi:nicotinamidase-related amidase